MNESTAPRPDTGKPGHGLRNTWEAMVESVPVDAARARYNTADSVLPPAIQANLRTGELVFNQEGIVLRGVARRADTTLDRMTAVCVPVIVLCIVGLMFSLALPPIAKGVLVVTPILLATLLTVLNAVMERRREPIHETIPWKNVLGAQTDRELRWISVLYVAPSPRNGKVVPQFISLNELSPAIVTGVAETISHFAPKASCVRVRGWQWTTRRKIIYGCFVALVLLMFIAAGISVFARSGQVHDGTQTVK